MKSIRPVFIASLLAALAALPAVAHHSFAAVYQTDETMRIEGQVAQFLFRNPHSVLHVVVDGEDGERTRWAVEWQGATQLGARGMSAQTLRPGDPVIVTGRPGRVEVEHRMLLVTIERTTDGFGWGTRPGEVVD
jgi:thiamine monophosphate kinase